MRHDVTRDSLGPMPFRLLFNEGSVRAIETDTMDELMELLNAMREPAASMEWIEVYAADVRRQYGVSKGFSCRS